MHGPSFEQTWIPFTQECFVPCLDVGKGPGPSFEKLEFPSAKDALCLVWLKLTNWFWKSWSRISSSYFLYFVIISPWKRTWPFILTNLNSLWIGLDVLKRKILNFFHVFSLFRNYLPLEKSRVLRLNKFEFPLPKPRPWHSGLERSPRKRKVVGCSNPSRSISSYLVLSSPKNRKWQLHC